MEFDLQSLLPLTIGVTLLGTLATYFSSDRNSRLVALLSSLPALAVTSVILWKVGIGGQGLQFYSKWDWIPSLGAHMEFGVDGLSASLAWLTALLTPLVILYSWGETHRPQLFFALLI